MQVNLLAFQIATNLTSYNQEKRNDGNGAGIGR
jgi:hypothetical protein